MASTYLRLPLTGTAVATPPFLQVNSFAVDDSDNSKLVLERLTGTKFNFATAFTVIIPFKTNWVTGPGTNYLMDLKSTFYIAIDQVGGRIISRHYDATTNEQILMPITALSDGDWAWIGFSYDGAGSYQTILQGDYIANSGVKVLVNNTETFRFGERYGYTVSQDMSMGNVLIVNKVMTAGELTAYYNSGVSVDAYSVFDATEIIHYYKADDLAQQTTVPDAGGVTATLRGALAENGLLKTTDVPS